MEEGDTNSGPVSDLNILVEKRKSEDVGRGYPSACCLTFMVLSELLSKVA